MAIKFIDTHNSNFSVVLAEDHSKSQKFAAQQLIKFVKKTTRVEMSLKVSTKVPKKAIILGDHPFIKENYPNIDFSHLGEEGYQWEFEENYIIIAGSKKRGTLYGVCSFLEEFLGVRFYDPEFFLIPKHESIELPEISKEKTPDFEYRMVTYINLLDPDFSFYQKVNMNPFAEDIHGGSAGKLSTGLMTHTFQKLVPWKKYYEDHPEYFALIDGERVGGPMSQLCLSNPDVVEIATKNVLKWFRQDPDLMSVGIVPNDVDGYCECKDCKKVEGKYGGVHSAPIIQFCNKIGKGLKKEFPEKFIHTIAYTYYLEPPKGLEINNNVIVVVCDMYPHCHDNHPIGQHPSTADYLEITKKWISICENVLVWHYAVDFIHFNLTPFPNFKALYENIKIYEQIGVKGILFQADTQPGVHGEFDVFKNWLLNKVMWDTSMEYKALIDDFVSGYYGPASEIIHKYFDEAQAFADKPETDIHLYSGLEGIPDLTQNFIIKWQNSLLDAIEGLNQEGENSVYVKHVKKVLFDLDYTYLIFPVEYEIKMGKIHPKDLNRRNKVLSRFKDGLKEFEIGVVSENLPVSIFLERQEMICQEHSLLALAELAPLVMSQMDSLLNLLEQNLDSKGNFKPNDYIIATLKRGFHPMHLNNWTLQPFAPNKKSLAQWTRDANIWTRKLNQNALTEYRNPDTKILTKKTLPKMVSSFTQGLTHQKDEFEE